MAMHRGIRKIFYDFVYSIEDHRSSDLFWEPACLGMKKMGGSEVVKDLLRL